MVVFFLLVSLPVLSSCVSTYTALQEVQPGSSKERVRNTIGRPVSVGRAEGMDRWTYRFKWKGREYTRDLLFDEGMVQKTGPLRPYPDYKRKMKSAETMDDYETNAILYQKQKEKGFREINSLR